jgi:hypothetical protein
LPWSPRRAIPINNRSPWRTPFRIYTLPLCPSRRRRTQWISPRSRARPPKPPRVRVGTF